LYRHTMPDSTEVVIREPIHKGVCNSVTSSTMPTMYFSGMCGNKCIEFIKYISNSQTLNMFLTRLQTKLDSKKLKKSEYVKIIKKLMEDIYRKILIFRSEVPRSHGDLHTDNILVQKDNTPWIIDPHGSDDRKKLSLEEDTAILIEDLAGPVKKTKSFKIAIAALLRAMEKSKTLNRFVKYYNSKAPNPTKRPITHKNILSHMIKQNNIGKAVDYLF